MAGAGCLVLDLMPGVGCFLVLDLPPGTGCLVLDVMPGVGCLVRFNARCRFFGSRFNARCRLFG